MRGYYIMFFQVAMNVHSNLGYITLKDKDPNSDPLLTFNFLADPQTAMPYLLFNYYYKFLISFSYF